MSTSFIKKTPRHYLPESFIVDSWETLAPYFEELESRPLSTVVELEKWLKDASELEAVISEEASWRQIRMTCDTEDPALAASFEFFMKKIQPMIQPVADRLNRKLIDCPITQELDTNKYFDHTGARHKQVLHFSA